MRGIPYPFLVLAEYRGPCPPQKTLCVEVYFQKIHYIELLKNVFIWYVISGILISIYNEVHERYRVKKPSHN
jgi:hypothetical protein